MNLGSMQAPWRPKKKRKRIGRGDGSGHGGTSTRGHKGQKARSGGRHGRGYEGGQMPIARRLPKRGFFNIGRREFSVVNLGELNRLPKGTVVDPELLEKEGLIRDLKGGVKILGDGDLKVALVFRQVRFSAPARAKIEASGGTIEEAKG